MLSVRCEGECCVAVATDRQEKRGGCACVCVLEVKITYLYVLQLDMVCSVFLHKGSKIILSLYAVCSVDLIACILFYNKPLRDTESFCDG